MTVTVYRSSDASAPVLNGVANALNGVLYACLVTGYGSKSGAGWAREYQNGQVSVYRAASGLRHYLRIDDAGTNEGRAVGYVAMSGHSTGTEPFPTVAQIAGGIYIRKSNSADAVARPWVLIADEKAFYFLPDCGGTDWLTSPTVANLSGQFFFGEYISFLSGDAYNTLIWGGPNTGTNQCSIGGKYGTQSTFAAQAGCYSPRTYTQTGTSKQLATMNAGDCNSSSVAGAGTYTPYPDPITGGMQVVPRVVVDESSGTTFCIRGRLPGLWSPLHNVPAQHGDVMQGKTGTDLDGYAWLLCDTTNLNSGTRGRMLIETSNTWRV